MVEMGGVAAYRAHERLQAIVPHFAFCKCEGICSFLNKFLSKVPKGVPKNSIFAERTNTPSMTHTFNLDKGSIRLVVSNGGKKWRKSTGLSTKPSLWNPKGKSLRARCTDQRIYEELRLIDLRLREKERSKMTEDEVLAAIEYGLSGEMVEDRPTAPARQSFWEYFDEWAARPSTSQRQRALAERKVASFMGRAGDWEDINGAYFVRLQRKMEAAGLGVNYRWNILTRLKCVMAEGFALGYHKNEDFRAVKVPKARTEAIALSTQEIDLLWNYEPKNKGEGRVRDLALVGYYTASRFSDYSRLSLDNVRDGLVEFVQQKTGDKVVLPASPRLVEILERNGGHAPYVHQVVFNRMIKDVAREAGICGEVDLPKTQRKPDGSPTFRWEMCQSHTFRRSAITALYLSGVPARECMLLSGHKTLAAFEGYLKISGRDAIERLRSNAFFK